MKQTSASLPAKRHQSILEFLTENESISIREAARLCEVSEATARRDLDEMASKMLLVRTHGGAVLQLSTGLEMVQDDKMKVMIPEKTRIAKAAAALVKEGNSIYLDSGTTAFLLARQLQDIPNITVITNNLDIAYGVKLDKTATLVVTGGIRRYGYGSLIGQIAEDMIRQLSIDISFIGADAIDVHQGIYNSNFIETGVKKTGIECAQKTILLTDHTKFRRKALTRICGLECFDVLITDDGIEEEDLEIMKEKIHKLVLV